LKWKALTMNRLMWFHFLGVLGLLVGVPLAMTRGAERFPLLRHLRPTVSMSTVRGAEMAPPAPSEPSGDESGTVTAIRPAVPARRFLVIEALPPPDVTVALENINTDETATFAIPRDGRLHPAQAAQVRHFFRCKRTGREKAIAPGTLALLAEVAQRWPGHVIEVVSGFRAPPYGAPHSKHFAGHAIDLRVRGVRSALVRDFIWRDHHGVGVGHYPSENFVHLDSRPGEPDMAWTGVGEDGIPAYSPRGAWRARHPGRSGSRAASPLAVASSSPRAL
jgi:uncharacterized protein YcbK (DUF882 family)